MEPSDQMYTELEFKRAELLLHRNKQKLKKGN